jgi:hypothetical protein
MLSGGRPNPHAAQKLSANGTQGTMGGANQPKDASISSIQDPLDNQFRRPPSLYQNKSDVGHNMMEGGSP